MRLRGAIFALVTAATPACAQFGPSLNALAISPPPFGPQVSSSASLAPTIELNFSANTASGTCADIASCISVTRASQEACTDSSGAITYAANNAACITSAGLQVWEGRTNIVLQSQALTNAAWTAENTT